MVLTSFSEDKELLPCVNVHGPDKFGPLIGLSSLTNNDLTLIAATKSNCIEAYGNFKNGAV